MAGQWQKGYFVVDNIHKEVAGLLAGLPEFVSEAPDDSLEHRLKLFLVSCYGPGWLYCELEARLLPDGKTIFLASLPDKASIHLIAPMTDGSFVIAPPSAVPDVSLDDIKFDENIVVGPHCLEMLSRALREACVLVSQSPHATLQSRARICEQLRHMNSHLIAQEGE